MSNALGALNDRGINDALQRRLQIGNPDYDLTLMPELAAVMPLGDATPELYFHMGWRRWQVGGQVAAVAAQNGQLRIGVQSTDTVIVVVESISVSLGGGTVIQVAGASGTAIGSTSLGTLRTPVAGAFRDGRYPFQATVAQVSTTTTAAPFAPALFLLDGVGIITIPGAPWILVPGSTLTVQDQTVNQAFDYSIVWRERKLMDQENTI